jgi:hypothetical protein
MYKGTVLIWYINAVIKLVDKPPKVKELIFPLVYNGQVGQAS